MTEREQLQAKFREAAARGQFDLADEYFQAAMEAGAKEMDAMQPGSGEVWRGLAKAVATITVAGLLNE
jgi:hypothetical protein